MYISAAKQGIKKNYFTFMARRLLQNHPEQKEKKEAPPRSHEINPGWGLRTEN